MSDFRNSGIKNGVMISLASVSNRYLPLLTIIEYQLKGHCIELKYYADGIHSGLTPPGNKS